jgi:GMP synthase-like glutamine amidotransferase
LYHPDDYTALCATGLEKDWIVSWYGRVAQRYGFKMQGRDIIHGDTLPEPNRIDAAILGGTIHLILEDHEWLKRIVAWLREYRELKRPLLSICGGHQMIAVRFFKENQLVKRDNGPVNGTYPIRLTKSGRASPLFEGMTATPQLHFANGYHVIPSPREKLKILATTADSPAVAVDYGDHWYGTQFHPEARKESWRCYFKRDPSINVDNYKTDHAGAVVIENFIRLSEKAIC